MVIVIRTRGCYLNDPKCWVIYENNKEINRIGNREYIFDECIHTLGANYYGCFIDDRCMCLNKYQIKKRGQRSVYCF